MLISINNARQIITSTYQKTATEAVKNSNSCTRKSFTYFLVDFNSCKTHINKM